jgi:hypothetical protein
MMESRIEDIPQVPEVIEWLVAEFSEKEIRDAIFQMKHYKAPRLHGFPVKFYQVFWSLIEEDLMSMFREFHKGDLPLSSLNFGIITLIPKEQEVKKFINTDLFVCSMIALRSLRK